ncbi:MAG: molybdenum cofactor biosynthesis protein MoaB [Candidatus Korarchaeum sp.]|nr:molybdenum cofactor biosynthesis protein MoaB [Candidatus Korarchaeum sp.]MDW8035746.1 molybdenum cofactor biosynthesis protein B [Candidatus Korarchaeum sp.]
MGVPEEHKREAPSELNYSIFIVSTSRSVDSSKEDVTGELAIELVKGSGSHVVRKEVIPDNREALRRSLIKAAEDSDVIIFCGGTGVSPSDITPETIRPLLDKELPGFGEIFRWLSYSKIGSSAIASRAMGGLHSRSLVFLLPGSPEAVELALEKLIIPEAPHLIAIARSRR